MLTRNRSEVKHVEALSNRATARSDAQLTQRGYAATEEWDILPQRTQSSDEGINDERNSDLCVLRASAVHDPKFAHAA